MQLTISKWGILPQPQPATVPRDDPTLALTVAFAVPLAEAYAQGTYKDVKALKDARDEALLRVFPPAEKRRTNKRPAAAAADDQEVDGKAEACEKDKKHCAKKRASPPPPLVAQQPGSANLSTSGSQDPYPPAPLVAQQLGSANLGAIGSQVGPRPVPPSTVEVVMGKEINAIWLRCLFDVL